MYRKKSTPIIIALLLFWSQTSNSFKLPNWLIASSIVGIGGAYFFAKTYNPNFNFLWKPLFARNKKPADSPQILNVLITPPSNESTPPHSAVTANSFISKKAMDFIFGRKKDKNPRGYPKLTGKLPLNEVFSPLASQGNNTNADFTPPVTPSKKPPFTPIPTDIPKADTSNNAVTRYSPGQLRAQEAANTQNTLQLSAELLAILGTKEIKPHSPLCIDLLGRTKKIIFELLDINTFLDAVKKSPEASQLLLSAKPLLKKQQANALTLLLRQAIPNTSTENSTTPAALTDQDNNQSATHRRRYSDCDSAYGGIPKEETIPSAYGGTQTEYLGLRIRQGNKEVVFHLGKKPDQHPDTYASAAIKEYNDSIKRTDDLINGFGLNMYTQAPQNPFNPIIPFRIDFSF